MLYKSPFKIENSSFDFANIKKSKGVIIFGTGNFGLIILACLNIAGIKVIGFSDNNYSKWNKKWNGYNVIPPKELNKAEEGVVVLIASLNFPYMKRQLKGYGITKQIFDSDFLFNEVELKMDELNSSWPGLYTWPLNRTREQIDLYIYSVQAQKEKKKLKVNSLDLVLTEKCSLKCVDCSNLMQFYAKPIDEDYETLTRALEVFMNSVDYVYEIRVIGGEPLIYKKIDQVIKQLLNFNNYDKIHIYTNGTIILKEDKMKVFQNEKVLFRISDYGKVSRHVKRLEKSLDQLNVAYFTERITTWQDCAKIEKYERSENLNKHIFGNCCVNQCLTMLHGKLYLCPYSAHAENLKAIPKNKSDSVDLNSKEISNFKDEISKLYFGKQYLEACKFCNGRDYNVAKVEAGVQTKEILQYEVVA